MRKIVTLAVPVGDTRRLMIFGVDGGAYLFLYDKDDDGPCYADEWYPTAAAAESAAGESYGVRVGDWKTIDDPPTGSQHDWIKPTRTKTDDSGYKLWGEFEPLPVA